MSARRGPRARRLRAPAPQPRRRRDDGAGEAGHGLWLLDDLEYGDLSFLGRDDEPLAWWYQWPFPLKGDDLKGWLRDMALRYASEALAEGYRDAVAVREELADGQPEGRA